MPKQRHPPHAEGANIPLGRWKLNVGRWTLLPFLTLLPACDRKSHSAPTPTPPPAKHQSVHDLPAPVVTTPPVQALTYDSGYKLGDTTGEAAAKAHMALPSKERPDPPTPEQLDVLALKAAGADATRGPKWQRGYAEGYRDAYARIREGRR